MIVRRRKWWLASLVYLVVATLLGFAVASGTNALLALSLEDKDVPANATLPAASEPEPGSPVDIARIGMPDGYRSDPLLSMAAKRLQDAVLTATGSRPEVSAGKGDFTVRSDSGLPSEGFRLGAKGVDGAGRQGMANGLLAAADAVSSGVRLPDLQGLPVVPDLEYRFADFGAVGVEPDPAAWAEQDDYSHNSNQFADVILPDPPYIDPDGLARATDDWKQYIDHIRSYGYNGVIVNGFLEYVNFDQVGDGYQIYSKDSPYRARHDAMVEQFGNMWKYAADMGMRVVFKTDMLANTGPLNDYIERELGGIDVDDPRLWDIYQAGLSEFFDNMPYVDGLMIRIGEAGSIYNQPGWDYFSTLAVTTVASVRTMLTKFTKTAADHDKTLYFRTWSVGVGDVGDMHTNPQTYDALLDGIPDDNLVVVTKFTMGDFYSWLPLNPTLEQGDQRRIVEFQSRREFEAFSSFPNYLSADHQQALQTFEQRNPNIAGVWVWTQDGGPWRAGPMSLYLKSGFWQLYDLDVYATGRLAWDSGADLAEVNRDWIARNFSDDPATIAAVEDIFTQSREIAKEGLYIAPYAEKRVLALGLEPPPMMWIFEWDIVSGDSAALSVIHHASRGRVAEAVDQARDAQAATERMLEQARSTDPATWHDPELRDRLIHSLEYEADLWSTLGSFRQAFLSYYEWLDTGDPAAWAAWQEGKQQYDEAVAHHVQTYGKDLDTPAYSFFAVRAGLAHAERTRAAQIVTVAVLVGILAVLILGALGRRWPRNALAVALRGLWVGITRPWRLAEDPPVPRPPGARPLAWLLPALLLVLSRGAFSNWLSWTYLLATLGSMALFTVALRLLVRGSDPFALYSGVGAALLLKTLLLGSVVVWRGPLFYWYRFWTDEQWRNVYVTLSFAAFLWLFWVAYVVMRSSYGCRRLGSLGRVLIGISLPMVALGALMMWSGLESALTTFNDQMALLPLGLSRILGITVHLGIPTGIPLYLLVAGLVLAAVGLVLGAARRPSGARAG
ncbi:MAG: hypothetical protein R2720_06225 [Candidatus Nanopelagicales bacterium]